MDPQHRRMTPPEHTLAVDRPQNLHWAPALPKVLPQVPDELEAPCPAIRIQPQVAFTAKGLPTKQVPFLLRNISTNDTHRLRETIFIGRSATKMRKGIDLRIDSPDISRIHCSIQANENGIYIFNETSRSLHVDGVPLDEGDSRQIKVGTFLRIGEMNMWVVERSSLFRPSKECTDEDPLDLGEWMEVALCSKEDYDSLRRCDDWFSFVQILLDLAPNCSLSAKMAPCVDVVHLLDNGEVIETAGPLSYEEMVLFPMSHLLQHLRGIGQTLRAHLSADPLKLAMVAKNTVKENTSSTIMDVLRKSST